MPYKDIFQKVDHTLLNPVASEKDIQKILEEAHSFSCFSACIPPAYVALARSFFDEKKSATKVCTVIGFPLGYNTTATKVFETQDAIRNGADEIDMVINQAWVKNQAWDLILQEIKAIKDVCQDKVLKVIVETCNLVDDEIARLTKICQESGADFIKTSTGFSVAGAKVKDIEIFRNNIDYSLDNPLKIKAAGGMKTKEDVLTFLEKGADRLGTSKAVGLFSNDLSEQRTKGDEETY